MPTDTPQPPRSPGSPPKLRLHQEELEAVGKEVVTYKFPSTWSRGATKCIASGDRNGSRRRLVAAKVQEAPIERTFDGSACGVVNGGDDPDCIGRIISSGQLVREIENTLDRMQNRLDDFRDEMDRAFPFPQAGNDDDLPPAA